MRHRGRSVVLASLDDVEGSFDDARHHRRRRARPAQHRTRSRRYAGGGWAA